MGFDGIKNFQCGETFFRVGWARLRINYRAVEFIMFVMLFSLRIGINVFVRLRMVGKFFLLVRCMFFFGLEEFKSVCNDICSSQLYIFCSEIVIFDRLLMNVWNIIGEKNFNYVYIIVFILY